MHNPFIIPLNPPLPKGDFLKDAAKFSPLNQGSTGDFSWLGVNRHWFRYVELRTS
jgi:hypothetical protein